MDRTTGKNPRSRAWISFWYIASAFVIAWDVGYCFMRPRSMAGGDLHWIWKPYALYAQIDYVYGWPSFTRGDGFANAQSLMNVLETTLNLAYVYYVHIRPSSVAPLVGFSSALMTLSKTVLYWLNDYYCSWCTSHNPPLKWIILFALPNGVWLVVPTLIVFVLGKDIVEALQKAPIQTVSGKSKVM